MLQNDLEILIGDYGAANVILALAGALEAAGGQDDNPDVIDREIWRRRATGLRNLVRRER